MSCTHFADIPSSWRQLSYTKSNAHATPPWHLIITVGAVVVMVYLLTNNAATTNAMLPHAYESKVSSKLATANDLLPCASTTFPDFPAGGATIIDGTDSARNTAAAQSLFGGAVPSAVIVFAHWCPHCKTAINALGNDIAEYKASFPSVQFVLVNAEAVPGAWGKNPGQVDIMHFPTFLACGAQGVTATESVADAVQLAGGAAVTAKVARMQQQFPDTEPGSDFDDLFCQNEG